MTDAGPAEGYRPFEPFAAWESLAVGDAWAEFLSALDVARAAAEPADLERAVDMALRSAALETGAIEGLYATTRGVTRTVALQGAMWEAELEKLGPDVPGHFEAQLSAFDLVLDAATNHLPLSEAWLRELHAKVCAAQKTVRVLTDVGWQDHQLHHGNYKIFPNNVILTDGATHWYAPVSDVSAEMHRLIEEARTKAFLVAHPVIQAAYSHHALTAVHPFADGNGRTARALASVFLYRAAGVPLVIFSDQQERYWDALQAADRGQPQAFVSFIDDRALDTMALVTNRLREAKSPLDEQATRIRNLFRAHGGLTHAEVQGIGQRLTQHLQQSLQLAFQALGLGPDVSAWVEAKSGRLQCTFWDHPYRTLMYGGAFTLHVSIQEPVKLEVQATPFVGIAKDSTNAFTFIVIDANRSTTEPLKLRVSDLYPSITASAELRIEGWEQTTLGAVLDELRRGITDALAFPG